MCCCRRFLTFLLALRFAAGICRVTLYSVLLSSSSAMKLASCTSRLARTICSLSFRKLRVSTTSLSSSQQERYNKLTLYQIPLWEGKTFVSTENIKLTSPHSTGAGGAGRWVMMTFLPGSVSPSCGSAAAGAATAVSACSACLESAVCAAAAAPARTSDADAPEQSSSPPRVGAPEIVKQPA